MFTEYKKKKTLEKGRTWVGIDNDAVLGRHGIGEWWAAEVRGDGGVQCQFLGTEQKR
jgi:hypothetical protein